MKHPPISSIEQQDDYRLQLRGLSDAELLQVFVGVYLGQDFQTTFEQWMARADVDEFKRRLALRDEAMKNHTFLSPKEIVGRYGISENQLPELAHEWGWSLRRDAATGWRDWYREDQVIRTMESYEDRREK